MTHLYKGGAPWSSGAARFYRKDDGGPEHLVIGVRCRLGGKLDEIALLDTGAEWSVISGDTAQIIEDQIEKLEGGISYNTRFGMKQGAFHRLCIGLLADRGCGNNAECDATVLVIEGWEGPTVLGFRGLLERVRIALDPAEIGSFFYFGDTSR